MTLDRCETSAPLNVRGMSPETRRRILVAARVRGMTYAEYLTQLVVLHELARARAETDPALQAELVSLGLQTIRG